VNAETNRSLPDWLPFFAGGLLVLQFAGLCAWQISRGIEKLEQRDAFGAPTSYANFYDGAEVRPYEALKASGHYDAAHQFLLDNIILESRYGYYVITPLVLADDEPLLLVNRGWIEKAGLEPDLDALDERLALPAGRVTAHGRVGGLPRAGMRMGDPVTPSAQWPKFAVFPRLDDVAVALGREVQPFVLLLDPEEEHGFLRQWVPEEMGPGRHFGYALQWFAMGAVLAALLVWHARRRRRAHD
jgi:surfeit locus 1 family protein